MIKPESNSNSDQHILFPSHAICKICKIWNERKKVLDWNVKYIRLSFHEQFTKHFYMHWLGVLCIKFMNETFFIGLIIILFHKWQNRKFEGLSNLTLIVCFFHYVIWILDQHLSLSQNDTRFSIIIYSVNEWDRIKNYFYHVIYVYRNFHLILMLISMESNICTMNFIIF